MAKRQEVHRRDRSASTATQLHTPAEARRAGEEPGHGQVRRDRRAGRAPRRRPPQGRPDGARHRRPAVGHRQGRPGRGVRHRRRRRRGPRAPAPTSSAPTTSPPQVEGGMLDFDVAIATPDLMAQVGKLGRVARPPRPDAEPQDRHRHHRRRPRPSASSRAARSSTAPTATATSTCRSARSASSADALLANFRAVLDELQRAKPASAKGRYIKQDHAVAPPWAPASRSTRTASDDRRRGGVPIAAG